MGASFLEEPNAGAAGQPAAPPPGTHADLRPVQPDGLPIFRQDSADYSIFYAPGYLCVVSLRDAGRFEARVLDAASGSITGEMARISACLRQRAEAAMLAQKYTQEAPFNPECLTLYVHNQCNLRCLYCYVAPTPHSSARLDVRTIRVAAELVAQSCYRKGCPFTIAFHGGGEPILDRDFAEQILALLNEVAHAHNVPTFRYVATNGVTSEQKASWLAQRFDLVGLSCDGPADIQNSQRPRWNGGDTSHILERTARILREEGCRLHVRTTITPATLHRQAEIADYICQQISPEEIHFEPVYLGGRATTADGLGLHHASQFVTHFLEAQEIAQQHGVPLLCSGARLGSIHGPYCHVFRHVLNLVPGGVATACFKTADAFQARRKGVAIGKLNPETGRFEIDHRRVQEPRRQLSTIPPECAGCFNCYHCARECPDYCSPNDGVRATHGPLEHGFRWRYQDRHIEAYIDLLAQEMRLWSRLGTLAHRPVSTVHFGGGTPTFLGEESFGRLVQDLHEHFHTDSQTEWALESTTSELTDEMFSQLDALGFTRLHVGVQSLEDPIRRLINRREPAATVLEKISRAVEMGWVVSVDLIFGLPGQSLEGLLGDIKSLAAAGVDGFSLYELQLSSRNHKFAEQHGLVGRTRLGNYLLVQAASRLLTALGYRKTLFNHFAREKDTNLYFTFPERGEDCLALGTIADGVFGDYHYRHPEYMAYCLGVDEALFPALQGGLRRNDLENRLHRVETAILAGCIPSKLLSDVRVIREARWENGLVCPHCGGRHVERLVGQDTSAGWQRRWCGALPTPATCVGPPEAIPRASAI